MTDKMKNKRRCANLCLRLLELLGGSIHCPLHESPLARRGDELLEVQGIHPDEILRTEDVVRDEDVRDLFVESVVLHGTVVCQVDSLEPCDESHIHEEKRMKTRECCATRARREQST